MEIKSKYERRTVELDLLTIHITPKDRDAIIEVLEAVKRKTKLDRLEEYILTNLMDALANPEETKQVAKTAQASEPILIRPNGTEQIDKRAIVEQIRATSKSKGESIEKWMQESISFAVSSMGAKTRPADGSMEAFYDFLRAENIIDAHGNPMPRK